MLIVKANANSWSFHVLIALEYNVLAFVGKCNLIIVSSLTLSKGSRKYNVGIFPKFVIGAIKCYSLLFAPSDLPLLQDKIRPVKL
jgi:hypothetical protein